MVLIINFAFIYAFTGGEASIPIFSEDPDLTRTGKDIKKTNHQRHTNVTI